MKQFFRITGLAAALLLMAAFSSCDMNADDDDDTEHTQANAPVLSEGAADAVSLSGTSVRLVFSSDKPGTCYVLVQNADAAAPEASGIKTAVTQNGAGSYTMAAGQNTLTLTGLTAGADYTAFIAGEDAADSLSTALAIEGIKPAVLAIAESQWYMGKGRLTFKANGKASIHGYEYAYTYNAETHTGYVSGNINNRTDPLDGKEHGDIINALGNFTVNSEDDGRSLTFADYRETNFAIDFTKTAQVVEANLLTGTLWA
jgi:hypothetical protein